MVRSADSRDERYPNDGDEAAWNDLDGWQRGQVEEDGPQFRVQLTAQQLAEGLGVLYMQYMNFHQSVGEDRAEGMVHAGIEQLLGFQIDELSRNPEDTVKLLVRYVREVVGVVNLPISDLLDCLTPRLKLAWVRVTSREGIAL